MTSRAGIWTLGIVTSAGVHLGAGAGLMAALQPQPVPDQPVPESRLNVDAQEVTRSDATQQTPDAAQTNTQSPQGPRLDAGAIAQSTAGALPAPSEPLAPTALPASTAAPTTVNAAPAPAKTPDAIRQQPRPAAEAAQKLTQAAPTVQTAALDTPKAQATPEQAPTLTPAAPQQPDTATSPQVEPEVTTGKAMLAFPAAGPVDPVSLAAFQGFMQPDAIDGADVRDSLSDALSLPCARMQVTLDPDSTTLTLTGHVPRDDQRGPVLAALQAQMGADIAVADNLLILPAPQCAALSGIAGVGLPQSTDQITNPMIVGNDTHARAFRFTEGRPLVIDMGGPDYDAFVYVDYFDADGNVIHLTPNDRVPLRRVAEKEQITIGARSPEDPGLYVLIGPPFGQEIAAAFAASVPLYEGTRPLVEPAEPYLDWLATRVAEARAEHADFKGEWVYFFVTTAAE